MWGRRYVPPERGRVGVEDVATGLEGGGMQTAASTAGTGVAAESWMRARKVKARPRITDLHGLENKVKKRHKRGASLHFTDGGHALTTWHSCT